MKKETTACPSHLKEAPIRSQLKASVLSGTCTAVVCSQTGCYSVALASLELVNFTETYLLLLLEYWD